MENWVIAYFESDSHAEIAGIFPSEESYLSCVPTLEKIAEELNMILTETTELTWEEVCQARQFTRTEHKIENLHLALDVSDNERFIKQLKSYKY